MASLVKRSDRTPKKKKQKSVTCSDSDLASFRLCGNCGYLGEEDEVCPGCGKCTWRDPSFSSVAEKQRAELQHGATYFLILYGILFLGMGIAFLPSLFTAGSLWFYIAAIVSPALLVAPLLFFKIPWHRILPRLKTPLARPTRWRRPKLPVMTPTRSQDEGSVTGSGVTLTCPGSGKRALAYRVAVRLQFVTGRTSWLLDEINSVDLKVGDLSVKGNSVLLHAKLRPVNEESNASHHRLAALCDQRGLDISRGDVKLFEAVLEEGQQVRMVEHANGTCEIFCEGLQEETRGHLALVDEEGGDLSLTAQPGNLAAL